MRYNYENDQSFESFGIVKSANALLQLQQDR
jgi:hypothetical protein